MTKYASLYRFDLQARMRLGRHATAEQVSEWVRFQLAFGIPSSMWLTLQAAEDGELHRSETYMPLDDLKDLGLIQLVGDFWTLTEHGRRLMARRRYAARKGWTKRDADKLAALTDEQIERALTP